MITLANTPVLTTDRLTLRAPVATDWPHWQAFAMSDRAAYVGGPMPHGVAWRAFCHIIGMWVARGYGSFVFHLRDDPAPLGHCGPWNPIDWPEAEIGWCVWSSAHGGKGLAFEAVTAARRFAFETLGWTTAVSYIDPANARSIRLAERLGAVLDRNAPQDPDDHDLVYRHPRRMGTA